MAYISTKEAAARWGVSLREAQRLLAEGRVIGATRYGNYWMIPADAAKPVDLRLERKTGAPPDHVYVFLSDMRLPKGDADAALLALSGSELAIAGADLAYRRGNVAPAKAYWREASDAERAILSAASLATAAAISSGDYAMYYDIVRYLDGCAAKTAEARTRALLSLPKTLAVVSMAIPDMTPDWLKRCDLALFPAELRPFLLYLYALHMRNVGDRAAQLATARAAATLLADENTFTWLDVNFLLLAAGGLYALGDIEEARKSLLAAMRLGLPNGFVMPFADSLGEFGGLMEDCLSQYYPAYRAPVIETWEVSFKNWMRFHNEFSKANVTTILTPQEYHVARLLASGETYAGVSRRIGLSVGRVKNLQTAIYSKLHIVRRSELQGYIL